HGVRNRKSWFYNTAPGRGNWRLWAKTYVLPTMSGQPQGAAARRSGVGESLRVDDLLQPVEHLHAWQQLLQARVRLALLANSGDELAVLELDAVHRHVDL